MELDSAVGTARPRGHQQARQQAIRNVAFIGHFGHGKSTLAATLINRAPRVGADDPKKKGRKANRVQMPELASYSLQMIAEGYTLNLIDTPGHVDYTYEVAAGLRMADGAFIVVDCIEGVCIQTVRVLQHALSERVRPILVISKLDRAVSEYRLKPEKLYQRLAAIIEGINRLIRESSNAWAIDSNVHVDPCKETVIFASGIHDWAFTLKSFCLVAKRLMPQPSCNVTTDRLWGDNYFDPKIMTWTNANTGMSGKSLLRGFCQFVLRPIYRIISGCQGGSTLLDRILQTLEIKLDDEQRSLYGKPLMKCVMSQIFPLAKCLSLVIVSQLPSPVEAQFYRVDEIYTGKSEAEAAAIRNCDPNGPMLINVCKYIFNPTDEEFYAFGRVFSGTVRTGNVLSASWGRKPVITEVAIAQGDHFEEEVEVYAGSSVSLRGDKLDFSENFKLIRNSVPYVIHMRIHLESTEFETYFKQLEKTCPSVRLDLDDRGFSVSGASKEQINLVLQEFDRIAAQVRYTISGPVCLLRETVSAPSSQVCLSISPNKHTRLFMTAEPAPSSFVDFVRARPMSGVQPADIGDPTRYGFNGQLWHIVSEHDCGPNVLLDATHNVEEKHLIKNPIESMLRYVSLYGVLCEVPTFGVQFTLVDAIVPLDRRISRGGPQTMPAARRVMYAAMLTAAPRLMEPVYLVEIYVHQSALTKVRLMVEARRGTVWLSTENEGTPFHSVKCYLPVMDADGFLSELRDSTGGDAFAQCVFDHWQVIDSDPLDPASKAHEIMMQMREHQGCPLGIPPLSRYHDRL